MLLPVLGSGPSGGAHVAWYPSLGECESPEGIQKFLPGLMVGYG